VLSIYDTLMLGEVCSSLLGSFFLVVLNALLLKALRFSINFALALSKGRVRLLLLGCFFLDNCSPASDFLLGIKYLSLLS